MNVQTNIDPLQSGEVSAYPYVELHCHSYFSLLDGGSSPEELAAQAARLGMRALALTDHDAVYGAVRFIRAAREEGIRPILGAELTLCLDHDPAKPLSFDPAGRKPDRLAQPLLFDQPRAAWRGQRGCRSPFCGIDRLHRGSDRLIRLPPGRDRRRAAARGGPAKSGCDRAALRRSIRP